MKPDLFKNLPSEITINIFSRLPVRSIANSKCVCKPWLNLLETDDFVYSHHSKSVPTLAFWIEETSIRAKYVYKVFTFEDKVDDVESHDFRSNQLTEFNFLHRTTINGAANGLLLLQPFGSGVDDVVYIVNPVTREYVLVAGPNEELLSKKHPPSKAWAYGFGASRISRQHKVVRINESECYVYTLETGSWRRVAVEPAHASLCCSNVCLSAFVGGNLYWTVPFCASPTLVACFDLETECFSSFDAPSHGDFSVLKDRLCFCECEVENRDIVLWLMKEKSWSKEFVIELPGRYYRASPINVFKNGDMLMLCDTEFILFYNSNKTKAIQEIAGVLGWGECIFSMSGKHKRKNRYNIALGTARGITYHEECRDCIEHSDIKTENYSAEVSDFGLAKLLDIQDQRCIRSWLDLLEKDLFARQLSCEILDATSDMSYPIKIFITC